MCDQYLQTVKLYWQYNLQFVNRFKKNKDQTRVMKSKRTGYIRLDRRNIWK